jgi:hypothetical protein
MWGTDEWRAAGGVLSGIATFLGVIGAGTYFLIKERRGFHIPNLSVSITCERCATQTKDDDWLAITVTLKKLDRGTLSLSKVSAKIGEEENSPDLPLWGAYLVTRGNCPLYEAIEKKARRKQQPCLESRPPCASESHTTGGDPALGSVPRPSACSSPGEDRDRSVPVRLFCEVRAMASISRIAPARAPHPGSLSLVVAKVLNYATSDLGERRSLGDACLSACHLCRPPCAIDAPEGTLSGVEFPVTSKYTASLASAVSCDLGSSVSRATV